MDSSFDQVIASYHRARESGQLFDTFYQFFLRKAPEIPPMFARTDFPHQKLMLRESILEMLIFAHTGSGRHEIKRLAERHRQLSVKPADYDLSGSMHYVRPWQNTIVNSIPRWNVCGATRCKKASN